MKTLVIATRNSHKVTEIRAIMGEKFRFLTLSDFPGAPEVIEDASTFAGNATKKAVELAHWLAGQPTTECSVLADDSGLEVDALGGAPGVHSARFAALDRGRPGNSSAIENNAKLLSALADVPEEKRTARFKCVIALTSLSEPPAEGTSPRGTDGETAANTQLFEGTCEGRIITELRGRGGFGYDPLFVPHNYDETFGELSEEVKNRLSHRAQALAALKSALKA